MAIIPGYEYDLFVSYAHADNSMDEEEEGWVAQFVNRLEAALRQRLGTSQELAIFRDRTVVMANSRLQDLLTATRASAVFLAVGSPSYVAREWTRRELETFVERNNDLSRLFVVECLPLNSGDCYPRPLDDNITVRFWKPCGPRNIPMPLSLHTDREQFSTLIHTVANDIAKKLLSLRLLPRPAKREVPTMPAGYSDFTTEGKTGAKAASARKTVLLAQTTEDVEDEAEQLRSMLAQYNSEIEVLPLSGYPQGGEDFKAAVEMDLARTDVFVQLLGKRVGRTPPDLPEGYTRFQAAAAKAANVVILQWRRSDLDPESVADAGYKAMLKGETVIASGLEAFKLQILKEVRKNQRPAVHRAKSSTVFINADDKDMTFAKEVERECVKNAMTAILPMSGSSAEAESIRKDLEENLVDCDMLVFIYGDTTQNWIRGQLKFFNKVKPNRKSDPKLLAICVGPPPKPEIGISFPEAHVIDCPECWNVEGIRKLILEIGA